jgi:hypothetical protein
MGKTTKRCGCKTITILKICSLIKVYVGIISEKKSFDLTVFNHRPPEEMPLYKEAVPNSIAVPNKENSQEVPMELQELLK